MKMQIIDQASRLFLEYGFKSVTMDDLSERLGVSKKTIYEHFDTKNQLVQEAVLHIFKNISCSIDALRAKKMDPIEETMAIKNQVLRHLKNEKSSPQFQLQKYYPKTFYKLKQLQWDKMHECYYENLERGIAHGFYRNDIDVETVFRLYYHGMNLIKDKKVFPPQDFHDKVVKDQFIVYHIRGIASPKGLNRLEELLSEESSL